MTADYFFSGVVVPLTVGEVAGFALVSLVSSFFVSLAAGLEAGDALVVGDAVVDGLETTTGLVAAGEAEGVAAAGLLAEGSQALENAAIAAKTINRNDLLIVFSSFFGIASPNGLSGGRNPLASPLCFSTQPDAKDGLTAPLGRAGRQTTIYGNCNIATERTDEWTKLAIFF